MWEIFEVGKGWQIWQIECLCQSFTCYILPSVISYSYACSSFAYILPLQNFPIY